MAYFGSASILFVGLCLAVTQSRVFHPLRHHGRHRTQQLEETMLRDGPQTASIDDGSIVSDSDQMEKHIDEDCPDCLHRDASKIARKHQVKKEILERLGFGESPPNVSISDMPAFSQAPLERILKRHGFQADGASSFQIDLEDEGTFAKTEKLYSFAREPPRNEHLPTAFFEFGDDTRRMIVNHAKLHVYLKPTTADKPDAELKIEVFKRTKKGQNEDLPVFSKKFNHFLSRGGWVHVPFKNEVSSWFSKPEHNHGIFVNCQFNGENLVIHPQDSDEDHNMYLEIETQEGAKLSRKRRELLQMDCTETSPHTQCCRYPLTIDFEEFGWDWVIAPKVYQAYYCNGQCPFRHLQSYVHTHVLQQAKNKGLLPDGSAGPCCYPTQMASLMMVYLNENREVLVSKIPGMVATRCGCA